MLHARLAAFAGVASVVVCLGCGVADIATPDDDPTTPPENPQPPSPDNPQVETCNGFDDDGDGDVDEGCACSKGTEQDCFPGPESQLTGACKAGKQSCEGDSEFATWGPCVGATLPQAEVCGDDIDQDCDGADLPCAAQPTCDSFTFGVDSRAVDIVWTIDQSDSMGGEIAAVKQYMNEFAAFISAQNVDYQVILIASRGNGGHDICIPEPLAGPACADGPRFKQVSQHVGSHSALSNITTNLDTIEGFMREGSVRHFAVVTDDKSNVPWNSFDDTLKARAGYEDYQFHSVVGHDDSFLGLGCSVHKGHNYIALSNNTGGLVFDICQPGWSGLFQQLAQTVSAATTQFKLKQKPDKSTIEVTIGGQPATEGTQWTYDEAVNQIVLKEPLPADGEQIKVCYDPA